MIDAGAVHGIPAPVQRETTHLVLFASAAGAADLAQPSQAIGRAEVIEVLPQLSRIRIAGIKGLKDDQTFKAIATQLPSLL
jgi:hypothetical protein